MELKFKFIFNLHLIFIYFQLQNSKYIENFSHCIVQGGRRESKRRRKNQDEFHEFNDGWKWLKREKRW